MKKPGLRFTRVLLSLFNSLPENRKRTGLRKKKSPDLTLLILLVISLLAGLLLGACGEQTLNSYVDSNKTPGVIVTGTPTLKSVPNYTQAPSVQESPSSTALSTPSIVPPTPTVIPTPTMAPTPTMVPTPTIPPTPTPVPLPTSLLLGQQGGEWGQITVYLPNNSDRLEALALDSDLQTVLNSWFQYAPLLIRGITPGGSSLFLVKIQPQLYKDVLNGFPAANSISGQVRAGYAEGPNFISQAPAVVGALAGPGKITRLIQILAPLILGSDTNKQLDDIKNKLDDIKVFLEAKEQASILGNFKYLSDLAANLKQYSPNSEEQKAYLDQLETIERESLQSMSLLEGQLTGYSDQVKNLSFDKSFVLFRNDDQVKKLNEALSNYKNKASIYETLLLVRGLAGEIRCALPFNRDIALSRLADVRQNLTKWRDNYHQFLQQIDQKIPQMDGLFADNTVQENLKGASRQGNQDADNEYSRVDLYFAGTVQKVNAQIQEASQPLYIVAELNRQGQLVKVSKLIQ